MRLPKVSRPFRIPGRSAYYCRFTLDGKRITKPLDTSDLAEAKQKALLLQAELVKAVTESAHRVVPIKKEPTLKDVVDCYTRVLAVRSPFHRVATSCRLRAWLAYFGDIKAKEVTQERILEWLSARVKQPRSVPRKEHTYFEGPKGSSYRLSPRGKRIYKRTQKAAPPTRPSDTTIHNDLAALRAAFRCAADEGLIDALPKWMTSRTGRSLIPKGVVVKQTVLPPEHIAMIKEACDTSLPVDRLILLLLYSGLRLTDALRATWGDVHDGFLFLKTNKTGQDLAIPLPESFLAAGKGLKSHERIVGLDNVDPALRNRLKAITGVAYGNRIFRRSFCSLMASAGINDATRARIMGHTSKDMTTLYTVAGLEDVKKAVEKLAEKKPASEGRDG